MIAQRRCKCGGRVLGQRRAQRVEVEAQERLVALVRLHHGLDGRDVERNLQPNKDKYYDDLASQLAHQRAEDGQQHGVVGAVHRHGARLHGGGVLRGGPVRLDGRRGVDLVRLVLACSSMLLNAPIKAITWAYLHQRCRPSVLG